MKKATKATATFNQMAFGRVLGIVKTAIALNMTLEGLYNSMKDWEADGQLTTSPSAWTYINGSYMCSCCGSEQGKPSAYCPDCGNRMGTDPQP